MAATKKVTLENPASWAVSQDDVIAAAEESMFGMSSIGLCIECGCENEGLEPDARFCTCADCGQPTVFGAEELLAHCAP